MRFFELPPLRDTDSVNSDGQAFGQFENGRNDFADLHGAEQGFCRRVKADGRGTGGDDYGGDASNQFLDDRVRSGLRIRVEDHSRGYLACGKRGAHLCGSLHPECVNAAFAQLGANPSAERPVFADDVDDWHPRQRV